MAVGDKQRLITDIVATVLNEAAQTDRSFNWFINKHTKENFGKQFSTIDKIFLALNGNTSSNQTKRVVTLNCDAYFGGKHNFIFEFDEYHHFSSARLKSFEFYADNISLYFSLVEWQRLCKTHKDKADKYRKSKTTTDFAFNGGRTAQRAYLDCFRDLLPEIHGLNPTLRINEFEVVGIVSINEESCKIVERLLKEKIK